MKILTNKKFDKKFKKLRESEKDSFYERLNIFIENPNNSILNNHTLKGNKRGRFSISIIGDLRAIYSFVEEDVVMFVEIDTHSNLYR